MQTKGAILRNYSLCLNPARRSEGDQRALITFSPILWILLCHDKDVKIKDNEVLRKAENINHPVVKLRLGISC